MSVVLFKEWAPDVPALGSAYLTECDNALPLDGTYKNFLPLTGSGTAAPSTVVGAIWSSELNGGIYFGTGTQLYKQVPPASYTQISASTYNSGADDYWRFVQYENLMIATNHADSPQVHTVGSSGTFATLATAGSAPIAQQVGVIGQFVMLGDLKDAGGTARPYTVQWSSIDQPRNWPTPGSNTAIASQSGEQVMNPSWGKVMGIWGNDQYGVIAQQGGLTRCTYVGGTAVFQFDEYEAGRGVLYANSAVQVGNLTYYISQSGFCVTDGTNVRSIGSGRVDNYFSTVVDASFPNLLRGAADYGKELIYWSYSTNVFGGSDREILIYNWQEQRWSKATEAVVSMFSARLALAVGESPQLIYGWMAGRTLGAFSGSPGTATFISGEAELNEGGYSHISGVKPLLDTTSATVKVGYRSDQSSTPTYTSAVTANSRSGYADFRVSSRYSRASVTVTGTFNSMQGVEFKFTPEGET